MPDVLSSLAAICRRVLLIGLMTGTAAFAGTGAPAKLSSKAPRASEVVATVKEPFRLSMLLLGLVGIGLHGLTRGGGNPRRR